MEQVEVTLWTDPACPFAMAAEPVRWALRWRFGEQLRWTVRMIGLTLEAGHAERLAVGAPSLQRSSGMPMDPRPFPRAASCVPAGRLVVAARELHDPAAAERLLRALRVAVWRGGLLDDPALLAAAVADARLPPTLLPHALPATDGSGARVEAAWQADVAAARRPTPGALAQRHKLGGPDDEPRYSAPSLELASRDGRVASVPGFTPVEAHEAVLLTVWPELVRAGPPADVHELLAWASEPLATAEVLAVLGGDEAAVRADLARAARFEPAGADGWWTLG